MRPATTLLMAALLVVAASANELTSKSTGADYALASEEEQEGYAYVISARVNKTRSDMAVDGQDIDGCLRGMLVEVEEGREAAEAHLAQTKLSHLAQQCAEMLNQPPGE
jgi:hypothetical protein